MSNKFSSIKKKGIIFSDKWIKLVCKKINHPWSREEEIFHIIEQADYVTMFTHTIDDQIVLINQYRPAVESYTWEFPAGMIDKGEEPEQACIRELNEETGMKPLEVRFLGQFYPDTGRLQNKIYLYDVLTSGPNKKYKAEAGLDLQFITYEELDNMIKAGTFPLVSHIAAYYLSRQKKFFNPK